MLRSCETCQQTFKAKPSDIGRFCSRPCQHESMKTSEERCCGVCSKVFHAKLSELKAGKGNYCSRKCYHEGQKVPIAERFWAKVRKTETCWLWEGTISQWGYGQSFLDGKVAMAHRVAWIISRGQIPDGFQIDHLCRVKNCVNPDHLEPVTQQENIRRQFAARKAVA